MIIPPECEPWIFRQRSGLTNVSEYVAVIEKNYSFIEPHLPASVDSILDIGCGMGGIDVYLRKRYPLARIELLDGDGDESRNGFNKRLGAFNRRSATEAFLYANRVSISGWHDIDTKERLDFDLVISLASWGYHYPISTYDAHGFCIADLRIPDEPARGTVIRRYAKRLLCAWEQ